MPTILDDPPAYVAGDLGALRDVLAHPGHGVPAKALDRNLLIATWNIREFGGLTEKWRSTSDDTPKRDLGSLLCITEIVSRFDVIAVQEVQGHLKALRHMLKLLGPDWGFLLTDVTRGDRGGNERMAFVYDTRRVKPSGLACELVVPEEWLSPVEAERALARQFARTPYAVSFFSRGHTFILVTLHVWYGRSASERTPELQGIADWMSEWAKQEADWDHNLIVLGDFNIDRRGDANYEAFVSRGLTVPKELETVPRSIFDDPGDKPKFYDQIAWFEHGSSRLLELTYTGSAGCVAFPGAVMTDLTKSQLSYRISDHFPLWAEFGV